MNLNQGYIKHCTLYGFKKCARCIPSVDGNEAVIDYTFQRWFDQEEFS